MFKRTRKTTPKKKSSKKVKKYQAGGDLRSGLIDTSVNTGMFPDIMPQPISFPIGGGSGGATGHIENIQNSANQAVGELGRARDAIGGGGNNIFGPVAFAGPGNLLQRSDAQMKKGGKVKKMKAGGAVRGAGKAQKGVRACKMR